MASNALRTRRRVLIGTVAGAAVLVAAGFAAGAFVRSPQQLAAEAAGPGPTTLTAPVERKVLTSTVVLRGDVVAAQTVEVTPSSREATGKALVTGVKAKAGDQLKAGQVFLEVSGRPLFALPGAKPVYRDLRPGVEGEDVAQLQAALKSLGHDPRETNGKFGAGTKAALAKFYDAIGYQPVSTGDNDREQIMNARDRVVTAEDAVEDAKAADPPAPKLVGRAEENLKRAKDDFAELDAKTGPTLPSSEFVFLPAFPVRLMATQAALGAEVKAPLVTLSSGALQLRGVVNASQHGLVQAGQKVRIDSETLGISAEGTVSGIGDLTTDTTTGVSGHPVTVEPTTELDPRAAGTNMRLSVAGASSDGEVLAVPIAALFATGDGTTNVLRRTADGREEKVPVKPGMSADGMLSVTPEPGASLEPGDKVVISQANLGEPDR